MPKDNIHDKLDELEQRIAALEALAHPPVSEEEAFASTCNQMTCMDLEYKKEVLS